MWVAFDLARIAAAVWLLTLMLVTGAAPLDTVGVVLATFVVTGLVVSVMRRAEARKHAGEWEA